MKIIIAGSRNITDKQKVFQIIDDFVQYLYVVYGFHDEDFIEKIVSGTANGIDKLGEDWARESDIAIKKFKPNWERNGKKAGAMRNAEMAKYADVLICIRREDSMGSKSMTGIMNGKNIGEQPTNKTSNCYLIDTAPHSLGID